MTDKKTEPDTTEQEVTTPNPAHAETGSVDDAEAPSQPKRSSSPAPEKRSIGGRGCSPMASCRAWPWCSRWVRALKWQDDSVRDGDTARIESLQVAKDSTIALLSYKPDTVEQQLTDARGLLTGDFTQAYTESDRRCGDPGRQGNDLFFFCTPSRTYCWW